MSDPTPLVTQFVPPFQMTVFLDDRAAYLRYRIVIVHESDDELRAQDFVECVHEPVFGIDVGDMVAIRAKAESMCRDLEAMR